jgi:hypothetical protein
VPFAFFDRLSPRRQRIYLASDAIVTVALPPGTAAAAVIASLRAALASENRRDVERACQAMLDEVCVRFNVPPPKAKVYAKRPQLSGGELHGLYEPGDDGSPCRISVWMRTAQRKQVVAFKTFLRTLIHELCHHLDYELYRFAETFHTDGFYKRESDLMHKLLAEEPKQAIEAV